MTMVLRCLCIANILNSAVQKKNQYEYNTQFMVQTGRWSQQLMIRNGYKKKTWRELSTTVQCTDVTVSLLFSL